MERYKIPYFIDERIEYGDNFRTRLNNELRRATHLICLVSGTSLESEWVWNVALGAKERYFDSEGNPINSGDYHLEQELCIPWKFVLREFFEESLVLETDPDNNRKCRWRPFAFDPSLSTRVPKDKAEHFAKNHLTVRRDLDGLRFDTSDNRIRVTVRYDDVRRPDLSIVGGSDDMNHCEFSSWNILVVINPLELGIEIVNIFYESHRQLIILILALKMTILGLKTPILGMFILRYR